MERQLRQGYKLFDNNMTKVQENIIQLNTPVGNSPLLLDKLAQPHTDGPKKYKRNIDSLKKRARAKYISRALVMELTKLDSPLKKSYWNTWHCSNILYQEGKKITTKYCNNRWCLVCNRIRTGKLIAGYLPGMKAMKQPYFVTLTIPNVPASELKKTIDGMITMVILIKNLFYSRRGFKLTGIRKLECTYNDLLDNYHPHFHFVIDGKLEAEALVEEWLRRYSEADRRGQDIRPADENSMKELFKYSTKLTTKSKITKQNGKTVIQVNAVALDVIFQAMYKRRIFQAMGFIKQVSEDVEDIDSQVIEDLKEGTDFWRWEQDVSDWINNEGEMLTGCEAYKDYELRFSG
jgi:plasmid rolling circle replication initiator protein Rep